MLRVCHIALRRAELRHSIPPADRRGAIVLIAKIQLVEDMQLRHTLRLLTARGTD